MLVLCCTCGRQATATPAVYALGDSVVLSGWRVTVNSIVLLPGDVLYQPAAGQFFCVVEWTLENVSGEIRYVMPERQALLECAGQSYHPDALAAVQAARLRQWMVLEGQQDIAATSHGAAAYQIPESCQDVRWTFVSGLLPGAPSVTFHLNLPAKP